MPFKGIPKKLKEAHHDHVDLKVIFCLGNYLCLSLKKKSTINPISESKVNDMVAMDSTLYIKIYLIKN